MSAPIYINAIRYFSDFQFLLSSRKMSGDRQVCLKAVDSAMNKYCYTVQGLGERRDLVNNLLSRDDDFMFAVLNEVCEDCCRLVIVNLKHCVVTDKV